MKWGRLLQWASVWLIGAFAVVACSPGPRTISGNGLYPPVLLALPVAVVGAVGTYVAVVHSIMHLLSGRRRWAAVLVLLLAAAALVAFWFRVPAEKQAYFEGSRMVFLQHELGFYFRSWSLAGFWLSMGVMMGAWRTLREARSPGQKEHM